MRSQFSIRSIYKQTQFKSYIIFFIMLFENAHKNPILFTEI